jgi:hypothetical protein
MLIPDSVSWVVLNDSTDAFNAGWRLSFNAKGDLGDSKR